MDGGGMDGGGMDGGLFDGGGGGTDGGLFEDDICIIRPFFAGLSNLEREPKCPRALPLRVW